MSLKGEIVMPDDQNTLSKEVTEKNKKPLPTIKPLSFDKIEKSTKLKKRLNDLKMYRTHLGRKVIVL